MDPFLSEIRRGRERVWGWEERYDINLACGSHMGLRMIADRE